MQQQSEGVEDSCLADIPTTCGCPQFSVAASAENHCWSQRVTGPTNYSILVSNICARPCSMSFTLPQSLSLSRNTRVVCGAIALMAAATTVATFHRKPRAWRINEVPIAFWAWRNQSPTEIDVRAAIETNHARALFLRAGQIDYHDLKLRRIRTVTGPLPTGIGLHLVYNGTRSLLSQLETVDADELAST